MKKLLYMSMAFVAILGFTACGSDSSDDNEQKGGEQKTVDPPADPKTYEQTVSFTTAAAGEQTVTATGITGTIKVVDYQRQWADVTVEGNQITVKVDANNTYSQRSTSFYLTDEKSNTLKLTVTQAAKEHTTEVDENDLNNEVSDWPSMSRQCEF